MIHNESSIRYSRVDRLTLITRFDRSNCTRIERNFDVPDFLKANNRQYGFMLNRDPPNAGFNDYDPEKGELITDSKKKGKSS